jgi:hypothetical protein
VGRDTPGTRANTPAYGAVPDHERCRARKTSLEPGASATVITYTAAGRPIARRCNAGYGNKAGFFGAESFSWIVSARSNSGRAPQGGSLKLVTVSGLFRRHAIRVATSRALFKAPSGRDAKPPRCAGGDAQELIFPAIIAVPAPGAGLPSEPPPAGERGRFRPAVVCCSQT